MKTVILDTNKLKVLNLTDVLYLSNNHFTETIWVLLSLVRNHDLGTNIISNIQPSVINIQSSVKQLDVSKKNQ